MTRQEQALARAKAEHKRGRFLMFKQLHEPFTSADRAAMHRAFHNAARLSRLHAGLSPWRNPSLFRSMAALIVH